MNMITRIAIANLKYHKRKNILTGIAVFLTALLLFLVPTVGIDMYKVYGEMVKEIYPGWHVMFQNVGEEKRKELSLHHDITSYGIRKNIGRVVLEDGEEKNFRIQMVYLDKTAVSFYRLELKEGKLPEKDDEIVLSDTVLSLLHQKGAAGDKVTVPYQVIRNGELDYTEEREFTISGVFHEEKDLVTPFYDILVSESFMKEMVKEGQRDVSFLFQMEGVTTNDIEEKADKIAGQFGIPESDIDYNSDYLMANYTDPDMVKMLIIIMLIVMAAGIITVYNIYYISIHQRIQEFGRLKAIGTVKRQLKQIVLCEGFFAACIAVPAALLMGTVLTKPAILLFSFSTIEDNLFTKTTSRIIQERKVPLLHPWIYLLVAGVTFLMVYLSLRKPMRMAGKVSVMEAVRFQSGKGRKRKKRKRYMEMTPGRLAWIHIFEHRKKSLFTIFSMSATGVLIMAVMSVLACTSPEIMTNADFSGEYLIAPSIEEGNKEHPEWAWAEVKKHNPLTEELQQQIEKEDGVLSVDEISIADISGEDMFYAGGMENNLCGIPETYKEELEDGIIEGKASYEDLKSGDTAVADQILQYWYPQVQVGSRLHLTVHDGDREYQKTITIIAIGDYGSSLHHDNLLMMAKEGADRLSRGNSNRYFVVHAKKMYDEKLYQQLKSLTESSGILEIETRKEWYQYYKEVLTLINNACYIFFGILSVICIMNLINTMLSNIHVRRKEMGMLQAIGMTDRQMQEMLIREGMFYTMGTFFITIGLGSLLGYLAYLYAKSIALFRIRIYAYPVNTVIVIGIVLLIIQLGIGVLLGRSVKKESLIDRIRFSE